MPAPPSADDLIAALRQTVPQDELRRYESEPGGMAIFGAEARMIAASARAISDSQQSLFLRDHSSAVAAPASGWRWASGVVTIERKGDLTTVHRVLPGAIILDGPGGRQYQNFSEIVWPELDEDPREVVFSCTVPGIVGNLDGYEDVDGLLTDEGEDDAPNTPGYLTFSDQSASRGGFGATIETSADPLVPSSIYDSGRPDQFLPQHGGLYVEITDSDVAANIGRIVMIVEHIAPTGQIPEGSGLYPSGIVVDDLPLRAAAIGVREDDGGIFTDYTAEAADFTADDVPLFPAVPVVNDAIYFAARRPFAGVDVEVTTPAVGAFTIVWEYWDGAIWTPTPVDDDLLSWTVQNAGSVRWGVLAGWESTVVDGLSAFWIRARLSVVGVVTQAPLARILSTVFERKLSAGTCSWRVLSWQEFGLELTSIGVMTGGRQDELDMIAAERGAPPRQTGESDESLRQRVAELANVASPKAIQRAVNRQLEPYGIEGLAIDVANGFPGLFYDLDAYDYYEPGDVYPENPFHLVTTKSEAFGWFWVVVPCLGDGEFGMAYDEGPTILDTLKGVYLSNAYDYGFYDGFPVKAWASYAAIYQAVDTIRAAGVGFTMFRSCHLNNKKC